MTDQNLSDEIELTAPVTRKGGDIKAVRIRKPHGGELRGLEMSAIIRGQYDQTAVCLSRCTQPALTVAEIDQLDPFDLGALSGTLSGFFMTRPSTATTTLQ